MESKHKYRNERFFNLIARCVPATALQADGAAQGDSDIHIKRYSLI